MSSSHKSRNGWAVEHRLLFGQATCLMFGTGLIVWGLAPTIMDRLITGEPPSELSLSINVACFVVALLYVGFHVLIKRRVRLAAWSAFGLSAIILGAGVLLLILGGPNLNAAFLTFFAALACFASAASIDAISKWSTDGPFARAAKSPAADTAPRTSRFVADGLVRMNPAAHQRMFMDNVDPRDERNVQPDLQRLSEANEAKPAA